MYELYYRGMWQMFLIITSAWYGKQRYYLEPEEQLYTGKNDYKMLPSQEPRVYSCISGKNMTLSEATNEFVHEISDY